MSNTGELKNSVRIPTVNSTYVKARRKEMSWRQWLWWWWCAELM
jgi:hypothetical protein